MKNHLIIKETTKNAEYDLLTYEVSADRLKLHGYQNRDGHWIHYDHPLFFNPKGRTFTTLRKI